ncbi:MAG TPA: MotA/TolQ/ExbB proton channel family protein [Terriglobia bacterium]|nr:MotA/TolQ/ExbB proton channel family protein [Terriglobia bacterium]
MNPALLWFQNEVGQLLADTGLVAQIVLAILLVFSVISWAVIFKKYRGFKQARRASAAFLDVFRKSKKLSEIKTSAETYRDSPLVDVFLNGYREIEGQVVYSENPGKPRIRSLDSVQRALQIAASGELTRREQWLSYLATTGAITPFIGLFGTVWGIIDAFHGLASATTASLHSVAPGISEALITTAAGLFAAIPAVIAYNYFIQRIKEFGALMDDFVLEFLNMAERNFT